MLVYLSRPHTACGCWAEFLVLSVVVFSVFIVIVFQCVRVMSFNSFGVMCFRVPFQGSGM